MGEGTRRNKTRGVKKKKKQKKRPGVPERERGWGEPDEEKPAVIKKKHYKNFPVDGRVQVGVK